MCKEAKDKEGKRMKELKLRTRKELYWILGKLIIHDKCLDQDQYKLHGKTNKNPRVTRGKILSNLHWKNRVAAEMKEHTHIRGLYACGYLKGKVQIKKSVVLPCLIQQLSWIMTNLHLVLCIGHCSQTLIHDYFTLQMR